MILSHLSEVYNHQQLVGPHPRPGAFRPAIRRSRAPGQKAADPSVIAVRQNEMVTMMIVEKAKMKVKKTKRRMTMIRKTTNEECM